MSDWSVLGRPDPAPGDVVGTRGLGEGLLRRAGDVDSQAAQLRMLADGNASLRMTGDYASSYTRTLEVLPGDLGKLGMAYRGCGAALTTYADALSLAKRRAAVALQDGEDADRRSRAAVAQLRLLLPASVSLTMDASPSWNAMGVEMATVGLDPAAREQVQQAVRQAQIAAQDLARARSLADQAAALRGDAEDACVRSIGDALDQSGIKDQSWLRREWHKTTLQFTWSNFITACRDGAFVMGVLALFFTGPIGWAFALTAFSAGAFVLADGVRQYGEGEIGLAGLALDGLYVLPVGGVGSAAKLVRMANLLRGGTEETLGASELAELSGFTHQTHAPDVRIIEGKLPTGQVTKVHQSVDQMRDWLPEVNPDMKADPLRQENCGDCALAVMRRWRGESAVAGLRTHTVAEMERATGVKQVRMSPTEIAGALKAKGIGSMAIVGVDRAGGYPGHWFNAYYDGEKVVSIDGQDGTISGWPPDYSKPGRPVTWWDAGVLND